MSQASGDNSWWRLCEQRGKLLAEGGFLDDMLGLELRKAQIRAEKKFDHVFGKKLLPGHYTVLVLPGP